MSKRKRGVQLEMFEDAIKAYEQLVRGMTREELAAEHQRNLANGYPDMARITAARLIEWEQQLELTE